MAKIKDTEAALVCFERAALLHAEATEAGDFKVANKAYRDLSKAVDFLKQHDAVQQLDLFLAHSSEGVRAWAATYLLPIEENRSIQILEEIALGGGIRSLAAEMTLKEWRAGTLIL